MNRKQTLNIANGGMIAALYVVLTFLANAVGLASGEIQVRISEGLCLLPCLMSSAVPGLTIGCLLANILTGCVPLDIVFGTLATLIATIGSYLLRDHDWLVPLPPVIANAIIVGGMLHFAYGVPGLWACMGWVGLGELIACYVIGLPLLKFLKKYKHVFE